VRARALEELAEQRGDEGGVARADLAVDEGREDRLDARRDAHQHAGGAGRGDGQQRDVAAGVGERRLGNAGERAALLGERAARVGGGLAQVGDHLVTAARPSSLS
jgi:hypothetical protein